MKHATNKPTKNQTTKGNEMKYYEIKTDAGTLRQFAHSIEDATQRGTNTPRTTKDGMRELTGTTRTVLSVTELDDPRG